MLVIDLRKVGDSGPAWYFITKNSEAALVISKTNFVGRFTMIIISNNYYSYDYLDSADILYPYTVIYIYVKTVFVEES